MINSHSHHNAIVPHKSGARNILSAFLLNLAFTVIAVGGGLITNSSAVLSESVHNLSCTLSIGLAWLFQKLAAKKPTERYPFGYKRFSLLGALLNAVVIALGSIMVLLETVFSVGGEEHHDIHAAGMLWIALLGIIFKGAAVIKTRGGGVNQRMVSLHMLSDMMGWVAVFLVSLVLVFVEIPLLDKLLSIMISIYILVNVIRGLVDIFAVFMERTPKRVDIKALRAEIEKSEGVESVCYLKIWSLDGEHSAAMAGLKTKEGVNAHKLLESLFEKYNITEFSVENEM